MFKIQVLMHSSINSSLPRKFTDRKGSSNAPCLKQQTTLGGTGDDIAQKILPTGNGGFMVCGGTNSADGDFSVPAADGNDAYIAKYNKFRHLEWTKTFGGTGDDFFNDIAQTSDGGYIAVGYTSSNDGDVSGNHGNYDAWVVKLSPSGTIQWQKCLGGSDYEFGDAGIQTLYGGYTIVSSAFSDDGDISGNHGGFDAWVVQLSPAGKLLFQRCYGGSGDEFVNVMVGSGSGSFIFEGTTQSNDGDVSGNHGGTDAWVVRENALGKIIWQTTVGDTTEDNPSPNIAKTTDGNIVIDGFSYVASGYVGPKDSLFSFQTNLNSHTGAIIWSKNYHDPAERGGFGVFATTDGGTVETGRISNSIFDGSVFDVLVSKFDANGKQEWYKTLGGSDFDAGLDGGFEDANGNLTVLCVTASTDGDVKNNHGGVDTWLLQLGSCGNDLADEAVAPGNATASLKNNAAGLSVYPNPVSRSATSSFTLQQAQQVSVQVFDINGRLIKTLAAAQMPSGAHQLIWNVKYEKGNAVGSGLYVVKLQAGNASEAVKISVIQ